MSRPPRPLRRRLAANARYLWALLKRFKVTFVLLVVVLAGGAAAYLAIFERNGAPLTLPRAVGGAYFLMMGQPTLDLPDSWALTLLHAVVPPLGIAVVADGLVRFGYLFFAKHRNDKEWIAVQSQSLKDHVVLCGAGRVGYRVLDQLLRLGVDVVVMERNESAPFVQAIRGRGVPLLIDDGRSASALEATHISGARAIVCATDDDLANLNIALDARRLNPSIRVVMRLFDDDLVAKVKDAFKVEALSTSALAAPAFAAASLDPAIKTSFELAGENVVVAELDAPAPLVGRAPALLQDELGLTVLRVSRAGQPWAMPKSGEPLLAGDRLLLQARLEDWRKLRERAG